MKALRCKAGHRWQVLQTVQHDPQDLVRCPEEGCGLPAETDFMPGRGYGRANTRDTRDMDPDEVAMHHEANQYLTETHAADILSGKVEVNENCLPEFRLQVPDHLRKPTFCMP